jgi:glycine dehydrogenase
MNAQLEKIDSRSISSRLESSYFPNKDMVTDAFVERHLGPRDADVEEMLQYLGLSSLDELIEKTVPAAIRMRGQLSIPCARSEFEMLAEARQIADRNTVCRSLIGLGYQDTITPPVILRNVMENPGWYTQYTPYQAEISQGRLEALVNFQTMVCDLTALELANSSLLDEGTAAAEAMTICARVSKGAQRNKFFVSELVHPHTIEVVETRAAPLGFEVVCGSHEEVEIDDTFFGCLLQYPASDGRIFDYSSFTDRAHAADALVIAACDILSLALLRAPGEWGADMAVGSSQRFGVPLGYGGPHAAFLATKEKYKREIPGRIIGISKDAEGQIAYRLALQTREQHIRREKATSNICTAQVLLAIMASMYAVYHGPKGIRQIAHKVNRLTNTLRDGLTSLGVQLLDGAVFDTITTANLGDYEGKIRQRALENGLNFRYFGDGRIGITLDETITLADVYTIIESFDVLPGVDLTKVDLEALWSRSDVAYPNEIVRTSQYLQHEVFNTHHSETALLRYIYRLQSKDLSLTSSMIPLGSCTMKLNATAEMIPVTWESMNRLHPFAPADQAEGYKVMIDELESLLAEITGMAAVSLQPNAGSQGEYAGLLAIAAYHLASGEEGRNVCLIPQSAHGTNPASAVMAGMKVVIVRCDENGNVDIVDLKEKALAAGSQLSCLMVTYPSTHGVFEESIIEICEIVHSNGGQVYMDGANMNAQVGVCRPGDFGIDVCHLNLHKTFCIPHGGGGPGVGPIAVKSHLEPFLPGHALEAREAGKVGPVASAPFGSSSILPIPWLYIRMMGGEGLTAATKVAILNANYIAKRLEESYPVLYRGANGMVAHECILDLRNFKREIGIEVADVAKRLMDYGFHAPTVSFPVVETLMVEPTESESKEELDRFCDAMIAIREEIRAIEEGRADKSNNLLKNAPHTAQRVTSDDWDYPYSRQEAAYPLAYLKDYKFWPPVARVDNTYGDRNLICSCVSTSDFE